MNLRPARLVFLCSLLFLLGCASAFAAAPGLDTTFGANGRVAVELGTYGSRANAVAVQPDGKIVVAGSSASTSEKDFMLFRLLADGSLDPEFDNDGTVTTAVSPADDEVLSLALQPDGKIIAAGYSSNDDKNRDFAMVRYNSDGSLDTSFGINGMAVTAIGSSHDEITDVTVQDDGGIVITGSALDSSGHQVVVLGRYLADGTPDSSFAEDGFSLSIVGFDAQAESVVTDADGRILVSGSYSDAKRTGLMVLGFDAKGQLDKQFGESGIAVPADSSVFSEGYGMFLAEDGTILVAGSVGKEGERDAALFRFTSDGKPDSSFENNGVVVTAASVKDDVLYDVAVIGETIAASGFKTVDERREFLLITYAASQDDPAKLSAAIATTGSSNGEDTSTALAAASDNSMVVVGESTADADSSALVSKYAMTAEDGGTAAAIGGTESGNQYILTGQPYEVTRTTAIIPAKILAGLGSVTKRGIVFSTAPNPVLKDDSSNNGSTDDGPAISNLSPSGTVSTTSVTLSLTTDVEATCKYSLTAETDYDQMEKDCTAATGGKSHSAQVSGLEAGKEYTYYVRCKNTSTNAVNTTDKEISFTVQSSSADEGPVRSDLSPAGPINTISATLSLTTDVDAICKYDVTSGTDYEQMANTFSETGGTAHSTQVSGLEVVDGKTYTYYIRCKNTATEEVNTTDSIISFAMQKNGDTKDEAPPEIKNNTGEQVNSSSSVILSISTNEEAHCGYYKDADVSYDKMIAFAVTTDGKTHTADLNTLSASAVPYVYYARCKDEAGNTNSSGKKISVIATPVVITNSNFASGKLKLTTDVAATCRCNKGIDAFYDNMNEEFTPSADGKTHEVDISSLSAGSYVYYARCKDASDNESAKATEIVVTVAAASVFQEHSQLIAFSDQIIRKSLQSADSFFVGTALAADATISTDSTPASTSTGNSSASSSSASSTDSKEEEFLEEGNTSEGTGTGAFSSRLENLKPGTFFYARAYAVKNSAVYYGNQVGFRTADSCFVATAAFGSIFHPSVQILRDFRDRFMIGNAFSRALVNFYYRHSPPLADVISQNSTLRFAVRMLLLPVVGLAWLVMQFGLLLLLPVALTACWHGLRAMRMTRSPA